MNNNDILRRIRYTFQFPDSVMVKVFAKVKHEVSEQTITDWLRREEDPQFTSLPDSELAHFLNGFIILKRGKKDGELPVAEDRLTNNLILRKFKIALELDDEDIIEIFMFAGVRISKSELTAFFRKPTQEKYKLCKDQYLRNFLQGLQKKHTIGKVDTE